MKDGPLRVALKAVARGLFWANRLPQRGLRRLSGRQGFTLGGACRRCARCCEAPAIRANAAVWHVRTLRFLFLAWQERVNGFVLVAAPARERSFVFRCEHFDPATRACDSYASRPGMCRDYPRALLEQASPQLLPGCGYRPVARGAAAMRLALDAQPMSADQRARLAKGLHLEE